METRARQHGPCWRVMETGHPSTRAVNSGRTRNGNRALGLEDNQNVKDLCFEDKDKDFPRGQQHWVIVKNGSLTDIYQ